jgi:exopolyphosphatase/guanosine-5'-triphosphate,3'-diphosphate pyrophosphatase
VHVAAIDIGTNTVRLLIDDAGRDVDRDQRITRLGEGVDAWGELGDEPMERTLAAVKEFADRARAAGAVHVRIAGTSALRDARNRGVFAQMVDEATGQPLEVLEGAREGRLAFLGATSWLEGDDYVVCDIGGGSTELISAKEETSVDIGSVRLRERYLHGDPPSDDAVSAARSALDRYLEPWAEQFMDGRLVGVAGTITTIAALDAGLSRYDSEVVHGHVLERSAVDTWAERLNGSTVDEIRALGPVAPGRADVIGAGVLILSVVMAVLGREELTVSERDILDGLVLDAVR